MLRFVPRLGVARSVVDRSLRTVRLGAELAGAMLRWRITMIRKRSIKTIAGVVVIVALAVLAFVAASGFAGSTIPGIGGAGPAALELTP